MPLSVQEADGSIVSVIKRAPKKSFNTRTIAHHVTGYCIRIVSVQQHAHCFVMGREVSPSLEIFPHHALSLEERQGPESISPSLPPSLPLILHLTKSSPHSPFSRDHTHRCTARTLVPSRMTRSNSSMAQHLPHLLLLLLSQNIAAFFTSSRAPATYFSRSTPSISGPSRHAVLASPCVLPPALSGATSTSLHAVVGTGGGSRRRGRGGRGRGRGDDDDRRPFNMSDDKVSGGWRKKRKEGGERGRDGGSQPDVETCTHAAAPRSTPSLTFWFLLLLFFLLSPLRR